MTSPDQPQTPPEPPVEPVTGSQVSDLVNQVRNLRTDLYGNDGQKEGGAIGFLRRYGRRNRWVITLDVIATIVSIFALQHAYAEGDKAAATARTVAKNQVTLHQQCVASNASRASILELWKEDHDRWVTIESFFDVKANPAVVPFYDALKSKSDSILSSAEQTYQQQPCPTGPPTAGH